MRNSKVLIFTAIILLITTYWSITLASDTKTDPLEVSSNGDKEVEHSGNDTIDTYIERLFVKDGIHIGSTKDELLDAAGPPEEMGMYEGGQFCDYGNRTYFINPDSNRINAIAIPGDEVDLEEWEAVELALYDDIKLEGLNEMEGLWMEIYDWKNYDIMVEREEKESPPFYLWLMEDSLFTEPS